jgi:hypothetical protein
MDASVSSGEALAVTGVADWMLRSGAGMGPTEIFEVWPFSEEIRDDRESRSSEINNVEMAPAKPANHQR